LHNPINLKALHLVQKLLPSARHIAVFDTAFHATLKPEAAVYPGPYSWFSDWNIKKYGFHGISHKYCSGKAAQMLERKQLRLVSCHLGGGCSLAAIQDGISIETTMGFTPLDGLMMRSRSGAVDPGILIYLLKNNKYSVDELDRVLNKESGMKGIFERSADLREITKAMLEGDERAKLTFDMFVHRLSAGIAAMVAALGGIDALLFTGGIGEHSAYVRSATCKKLQFLNLAIDEKLNDCNPVDKDVAKADSQVRIFVVKAREDWQIACECAGLA
jgi:acetate kinase